jgi:hypothetical protein
VLPELRDSFRGSLLVDALVLRLWHVPTTPMANGLTAGAGREFISGWQTAIVV